MEVILAAAAGLAATGFTLDLVSGQVRRPRPHVAAYAAGMAMFSIATWALLLGLTVGWSGAVYRVFFLFGGILNIPYLALGSMFLVAGRRAGHTAFLVVGAITAIATTLTATVPFARPLPSGGVPEGIFPPIGEGFTPRLLAAIGGGLGATVLIALAVTSVVRFARTNRRLIAANLLIVAGTLAASAGGSLTAFGEGGGLAVSLLAASVLIWLGYRTASLARPGETGS